MSTARPKFLVSHFEHAVYTKKHELAGRLLLQLLVMFDNNYGNIPPELEVKRHSLFKSREDLLDHVFTRIAAAITALFADPDFQLSPAGFMQLLPLQRWLGVIFSFTPMRNADHVIYSLNNLGPDSEIVQWHAKDVYKMALLTLPDSEISLDLDLIWKVSPALAVCLASIWVTPRLLGTPAAHHRREVVLGWLPERLMQLSLVDLETLPKNSWHDLYMHCSYAQRHDKHRIKKSIHLACHQLLMHAGIQDLPTRLPIGLKKINQKPIMLVVLEWFHAAHSIYRTHSMSLRAMKESFYVIGMGQSSCVDDVGKAVFDEFHELMPSSIFDQVAQIRAMSEKKEAAVIYMPSIGMNLVTIFAASLRLAPVQVTALGHGASTQSPWVDYFAVDEDFVGDVATYSEKVLALPIDAMPIVTSSAMGREPIQPIVIENPAVVKIAIAATTMKINPIFLETLHEIAKQSPQKIHFEFFMGFATEIIWPLARRMIHTVLGDQATVYPHLAYPEYLEKMNQCDMFITPFPYGNMNGIADAVTCGLVGVCKSGAHVHEHIDVGLFKRLNMPSWAIAETLQAYVAAVLRMANEHSERIAFRKELLSSNPVQTLHQGRAEIFGKTLLEIIQKY